MVVARVIEEWSGKGGAAYAEEWQGDKQKKTNHKVNLTEVDGLSMGKVAQVMGKEKGDGLSHPLGMS